MNPFIHLP
jgi:hypothetical protein